MGRNALLITVFVVVGGSVVLALPWIRDMWTGPVVLPQTEVRNPPPNSIAIDGLRVMNRREARLGLTNPIAVTEEIVNEGQELYTTYCGLCHGPKGRGDGGLASYYRRMPDLTARHVLNYPDGFLYTIIREGGRNMPRFADAISINERWALVHFLRTLENPESETTSP